MNIMKRMTVAILLLVIMATICACGNNDSTGSQREQTPLPTVENIINAFVEAGYLVENGENTISDDMVEDGVTSYAYYQLIRESNLPGISEQIPDFCELHFYQFADENNAERFYNMVLNSLDEEEGNLVGSFVQTDIQGGKRAVSKAPFGDGSIYGASSMLSQQKQTVVLLHTDWDDYQDVHLEYDYLPEEILKAFGY